MLESGVIVARTADDLPRYHGKFMIVDDALYVLGFNYTRPDIEKSRSFGIVTREPRLVKEALMLYEADSTRQAYAPADGRLVVSPENARTALAEFTEGAETQLLVYDSKVSDRTIIRLL